MSDNSDSSTVRQTQPVLCANGCGFYGNPMTQNCCSKCHRDLQSRQKKIEPVSQPIPEIKSIPPAPESIISPAPEPIAASQDLSTPAEEASSSLPKEVERTQETTTRCFQCNKKIGLTGFKCRCSFVFCGTHRYSDQHECSFDYKSAGKEEIKKANPVVQASKLTKI
mmetsp:Transcript_31417/g.50729  ORF Transcript_31417/g.50729 Transcript_31417/m.50729 type:complete len:167 (-) Transcript_31417:509-1009(-)|eukprot:CAMPEP_0184672798 /NCGR_PEP_ID=MMETSP0308-20130426/86311_1 /TAXON_ID=38269 /ORGANISM="Gloeochaete witrockiana, Strain SAG 46.84" /LENGTH=166 /DNA_ID=CAMNT_0027120187 /DNA_START=269 /DNA_END=769 /DNA_ORIENTATION=-